jgi:hypothetical protein
MINKGITALHFYLDAKDNIVHPSTAKSREVIIAPGEEITVKLSAEQEAYYRKTGHIQDDAQE